MPSDHTSVSPAPHDLILNIVTGFWKSRALAVAAELELADLLADGPLSADTLADQTKTDAASLFRLLRVLESIGLFRQVSPGMFANTPASDCLRRDVPGSQWASVRTILSVGYGQYEAWGGLLGSIQTGEAAFDQVFGCNAWEWYPRHPEVFSAFNETMRSLSAMITPAVTAAYDWSRFPVIADVGGGIGTQLADILNANPTCQGILWDQPGVVAGAIAHDRMKAMGGDFFKSVPPGADAYILRWIVHDWANPQAISILKNVREVMKPGSCLVLIEEVIPEPPKPTFGMWLDLHMLVMHRGRERTATEYGELYAQSGLELERIVPTASPMSLTSVDPGSGERHGGSTETLLGGPAASLSVRMRLQPPRSAAQEVGDLDGEEERQVVASEVIPIEYGVYSDSETDAVAALLGGVFSRRDPPALAAGLTASEFEGFVRLLCPTLKAEGLTIVARHAVTQEVVGVLLTQDSASPLPDGMDHLSPKFDPIFDILGQLDAEYRAGRTVHPGESLHLFLLGVSDRVAGRRVGQQLVAACLELGVKKGYRLAVTEATNKVSQHIFRKMGFEERVRRSYQTHRFAGRAVFASIADQGGPALMDRSLGS